MENIMRRLLAAALTALAFSAAQAQVPPSAAPPAQAAPPFSPNITITPVRPNGLYAVGERVSWTVRVPLGMPGAHYTYEVRENNFTVLQAGPLDLSSGAAVVEGSLSRPGMISVVLRPVPPANGPAPNITAAVQPILSAAAAVGIRDIRPGAPRPADFKQFWDAKLAALRAIPVNPKLTPVESGNAKADMVTVTLDSAGSQVQGYLATPKGGGGKYPALVIFQYAGVYALQKETAADRAAEGWLAFNVDSHDMPPDQATAPRNYASLGNSDRETSYFLNMYLRDVRAIDYIRSRPDWDGRTVVIMGTSMGGQQSYAVAGLVPEQITAMLVNVPAGANIVGDLYGQRQGYPNWNSQDPKVAATAPYFDSMSFAPEVKATSLVALGFLDLTSPPYGTIASFNAVTGPKEMVPMVESDHNHITPQKQEAWYRRSREVLEQLRTTGRFTPNVNWDR
jgi:cephalosporin-C deacetylase-like acetyl esterase